MRMEELSSYKHEQKMNKVNKKSRALTQIYSADFLSSSRYIGISSPWIRWKSIAHFAFCQRPTLKLSGIRRVQAKERYSRL